MNIQSNSDNFKIKELQEEVPRNTAREPYHAPQIKIHGKLARLTLQGGGASAVVDPNSTPLPEG